MKKIRGNLILLHAYAPAHLVKQVQETIGSFCWEIFQFAANSPNPAPCDYHLFSSMGHARFFRSVKKLLDEWFAAKDDEFYWRGVHKFPERWEKCIVSDGKYFE